MADVVATKPEITKAPYIGEYMQEMDRTLAGFIRDMKRMYLLIEKEKVQPIDEDIIKWAKALKEATDQTELMFAVKFPKSCDISADLLEKHYGIKTP